MIYAIWHLPVLAIDDSDQMRVRIYRSLNFLIVEILLCYWWGMSLSVSVDFGCISLVSDRCLGPCQCEVPLALESQDSFRCEIKILYCVTVEYCQLGFSCHAFVNSSMWPVFYLVFIVWWGHSCIDCLMSMHILLLRCITRYRNCSL